MLVAVGGGSGCSNGVRTAERSGNAGVATPAAS
ncbi:jg2082, partial [Pararge aegeria aegeria]